MSVSRRTILRGAGALPLVAGNFGFAAFAQAPTAAPGPAAPGPAASGPAASGAVEVPPILFVHGNGDHAARWITTMWRMESNGVPRDRMFAINFTDPLARADDTKPEPNKSSTEDQRRELGAAIKELKRRTGARAWRSSAIRAAVIRSAATSKAAGQEMSVTPCCAASPTTASMIGIAA
jgi:hypothetical protein